MLIYIDDSIKDVLLNNCTEENKAKIENVFQDMYVSLRKNRHIIYGEPESIDTLEQYYKPTKGDLYKFFQLINMDLLQKYDFLNDEIKPIFYAHIFFDRKKPNKRYNDHIEININCLDKDNDLFEYQTRLLVENPSDSKFYGKVVEYYINKNINYRNLFYSFKYENGGGSVIKDCYEDFAKEGNAFCIAITDKDCIYEGYEVKDSAACKIVEVADSKEPFNCKFLVIAVRDIENLIPLETIKNVKENEVVTNVIQNNIVKKNKIIKYFDYKKGITTKGSNQNEKDAEIAFWKTVFINTNFNRPIKNKYVNGFGDKILTNCLSLIDNSINLYSNLLETAWKEIGKFIFSYCCTYKKISQIPNY